MYSRTRLIPPVLVIATLVLPSSGPGQDDAFTAAHAPLVQEIRSIVASQTMGDALVGIDVVDVATGRRIYGMHEDRPLNPASNVKILTAWAALRVLRPEFTFETAIYGDPGPGTVQGRLTLKGYGDPSFGTDDLAAMVHTLETRGLTRVSGPVVVDDTFFDDVSLPYAFDEFPKSDADSPFRAPVGAVSFNSNTMEITVGPGTHAGAVARVEVFPSGYPELRNETMTVADGTSNVRIYVAPTDGKPVLRVWGPVAGGTTPRSWDKRVDDPSMAAGWALKEMLEDVGIECGEPERGQVPAGSRVLARHTSLPLGALLLRVGKNSDNFYAEQLLKVIGAEAKGKPGTAEKGTEAVMEVLLEAGIEPTGLVYRNGSGLYDANMIAPSHLTAILSRAWFEPDIRSEFVSQLATGGADGTLVHRYKDPKAKRRVRAKTGTLKDTSALSGYVLAPEGGSPIAFSILVNKAPGRVAVFRTFQEKIVTAIAQHLWR